MNKQDKKLTLDDWIDNIKQADLGMFDFLEYTLENKNGDRLLLTVNRDILTNDVIIFINRLVHKYVKEYIPCDLDRKDTVWELIASKEKW